MRRGRPTMKDGPGLEGSKHTVTALANSTSGKRLVKGYKRQKMKRFSKIAKACKKVF